MKLFFTFLSFLFSSFIFANNIQLQKVSLADTNRSAQTVNIKMNISWEHSWRDAVNWDAAWIIVKYKEAKDSIWKWKHAQLVQSGNSTGTATGLKIVVPNDLMGAFFYRSTIGAGNISSDDVKFLWNYGAAGVTNIDSVEVRVFATEMVYVPQGSYCLGDGDGTSRSENSFQLKNAPNNYAVINEKWSPLINTPNPTYHGFSIVGDDQIVYNTGIRISGLNGLDVDDDKVSDFPDFPTGYRGFYCMKYKVTQGQYTDFLNTVCANDTSSSVLDNFVNVPHNPYFNYNKLQAVPKELKGVWISLGDYLTSSPDNLRRHSIMFDSVQLKFTVTRPDRAYGLMDRFKSLSFSEWFGLRPMSELEYEKTCRGPLPPMKGEYAWGPDFGIPQDPGYFSDLTLSGVENGAEYFSNYNITKRYIDPSGNYLSGGDGGNGPYRVGIYANDTSSRISSNASYYGIMDLSKITSELVYPLSTATSRLFSNNIHGKGIISGLGKNYSFSNVEGVYASSGSRFMYTSQRGNYASLSGFRAVRLAPSDN